MLTRFFNLVLIFALISTVALAQTTDPQKEETYDGRWMADAIRLGTGADCSVITATEVLGAAISVKSSTSRTTSVAPEPIVVIEVSGSELMSVLKECLRSYPRKSLRFPHVSGISAVYNQTDKQITNLEINLTLINESSSYRLATTAFLADSFFNKPQVNDQQYILSNLASEYQERSQILEIKNTRIKIQ